MSWELLQTRYNQPTKIVDNHLKALFHASPLQQPSYNDIRSYLNQIEAHYKALQALIQPTVDTVLLYLFTSKLDPETEFRWKERIEHTPFASVGDLFKFLHAYCKLLEATGSTCQTPPRPTTYPDRSRVRNQDGRRSLTTNQTSVAQPQGPYNLCNGPRAPRNCRKFLSMSVPEIKPSEGEKNLFQLSA